jgi:hypothetical protein
MPIQFPPSPSVNQEYTYEGKVWAWDGSSWVGVRQETGIQKSNIWAKQNLLIPKRGFGLNSGYNGTTDQRRTKAGTIPMLKQYIERDLGLFGFGWTPDNITTSVWLDAADTSTIFLNSTTVSQWNDKSGNGRNFSQATAGNQPTYQASGINSKPSVAFTGSNDNFMTASSVLPSDSMAGSIFWVQTTEADPGNNANNIGCLIPNTWGGGGATNHMPWTDGNIYFSGFSTTRPNVGNPSQSLVNPRILGHQSTNGNVAFYIDGSSLFTSESNTFSNPATTKRLGQPGSKFTGQVAELIVLSNIPTTTDRQLIEGYLAHKWGLQANLPSDHPYKSSAP